MTLSKFLWRRAYATSSLNFWLVTESTSKTNAHEQNYITYLKPLKKKAEIAAPKYKKFPRGFEAYVDEPYAYLSKFGSMYAFKTFKPDKVFHSEELIQQNFKVYEDMLDLHRWVYELTLH